MPQWHQDEERAVTTAGHFDNTRSRTHAIGGKNGANQSRHTDHPTTSFSQATRRTCYRNAPARRSSTRKQTPNVLIIQRTSSTFGQRISIVSINSNDNIRTSCSSQRNDDKRPHSAHEPDCPSATRRFTLHCQTSPFKRQTSPFKRQTSNFKLRTAERPNEPTNQRPKGGTNERTTERAGERTNERKSERTNERTNVIELRSTTTTQRRTTNDERRTTNDERTNERRQ